MAFFAVVAAGIVWLFYSSAAMAPEETMSGIWEAESLSSDVSQGDRAEALYRLGLHREQMGDWDGAMEAYHRLLTELPYEEIDYGFRQDEARWHYRALLERAGRGEIRLGRSWPAH